MFRQFDDLKTRKKSPEELVMNDYFTGYHPDEHAQFIFERVVWLYDKEWEYDRCVET